MTSPINKPRLLLAGAVAVSLLPRELPSQDRLKSMPGYEQYARMAPRIGASIKTGAVTARWADDSRSLEFTRAGTRWEFDIAARVLREAQGAPRTSAGGIPRGAPSRGRQWTEAWSADSSQRAVFRDRNIYITDRSGANERQVTRDGSETARIKYGTASWVYGEELGQTTAMWWSPDGTRLAYYRFDERPVKDFWLQTDQTRVQGTVMIEAYPKAGTDNPIVDIYVYDTRTGASTPLDIRFGRPVADDVVGYYTYNVNWSKDGTELLMNRSNRKQNITEMTACAPASGTCRVVVREEWPASWTTPSPAIRWLDDGKRFIWRSERTGYQNYYLYDLSGKLIAPLTSHPFEVGNIVKVDERANQLWYYARSGDNYLKLQLHRVGLDGRGDRRLTDPSLHHTATVSPDGKYFTDAAESHDQPPTTRLFDATGKVVATLAESDISAYRAAGFSPAERFEYTAADGSSRLSGLISKPSNFDPARRYPVLFSVYNGPATNGASESFTPSSPFAEFGFLIVTLDTRSAAGRGKRALDALYGKLGETEIADLAAASRELAKRPYVDGQRVGIFGTSYGGYSAALALLKHPDAFAAAAASSPVTSWDHYDTIYTERFMSTPQANPDGYKNGNAMRYAPDLKGRLMIYYGTADDNVHPNNAMQLIKALQQAGKSFDVQVGPDQGHSSMNWQRMMEFFIEAIGASRISS